MAHDDPSQDELQARVEQQREQLAETVDALAAKLDVKAQAQARVEEAKATVKDRTLTPEGKPRPDLLAAAAALAVVAVVALLWKRRDRRKEY